MEQNIQSYELVGGDLIEMEGLLCRHLAAFFSFSGHALYFPRHNTPDAPLLLPRERRLLLPLFWKGLLLGVFMAHGVRVRALRVLLPALPAVALLCLENLACHKRASMDSVTGLLTEETFFARIEDDAANVRACLDNPDSGDGGQPPLYRLCMGIVLLRVFNAEEMIRQAGYAFGDSLMRELALACASDLPQDVRVARVGRDSFALLLPTTGSAVCYSTATAALARMDKVSLIDPLTQRPARPLICAGYALYPQDMRWADDFALPVFEQARRLMALAGEAADVARQASRVMPFARILQDGGVILESLPRLRLRISLGRSVGACEGARFAVKGRGREETRGKSSVFKGEIVLMSSRETESVAEILHVADSACMPEPGDSLTLLDKRHISLSACAPACEEADEGALSGICGHAEFLRRLAMEAERCSRFVLAIARVDAPTPKKLVALAAACVTAARSATRRPPLIGRYGTNSLIAMHPETTPEELLPVYADILKKAKSAVGLAGYPFLHYSVDEIRDCALKALEYALLLPEPRVGECNSLALNISADRLYSFGDVFGAVEEYRRALLVDKNNAMAWNSLGVCMAVLGRAQDARRNFLQALRKSRDSASVGQACYNLGAISEKLGQRRAAFRYYRRCIAVAPNHYFAYIRLGRACEQGGRRAEARRLYEIAAGIDDAERKGRSVARRQMAALAVRRRRGAEARELLHEALLRDPKDAAAMLLLADLYLDKNEDPGIAEMLARKSVGIHERPEAWRTLARALRALNREEDARRADARAKLTTAATAPLSTD
ncbi:MAG: diguanylate cyclase domain-containing protein [Candidatus Desulfovibrio kirbyi]|uniref:Diguanylate cyclase domain-containing protein n=1 Tax=Candidatus Desulfovibrio kirbyi TaxID=2696086 RepID=A0A6L2R7G8_9BACT|nr:MAG: diguanylate cyclase domain-containing protein [Candidatus Desulfovibrio kirbyi]